MKLSSCPHISPHTTGSAQPKMAVPWPNSSNTAGRARLNYLRRCDGNRNHSVCVFCRAWDRRMDVELCLEKTMPSHNERFAKKGTSALVE